MPTVGRKAPQKTHTKTVRFDKSKFSKSEAVAWLKDHELEKGKKFYTDGYEETDGWHWFSQYDSEPDKFRYRDKEITDGIWFKIGYPKESESMREMRVFTLDSLTFTREARADGDGEDVISEGRAAVFDKPTELWSGLWEVVRSSFFDTILKEKQDVRHLFNHDPSLVLGRTAAGTHRIWKDDSGLAFENRMPDTSYARDLVVSMERGDVSQCSFSFTIARNGIQWATHKDQPLRELVLGETLWDTSIVTYPAYEETDASLRELRAISEVLELPELVSVVGEAARDLRKKKLSGDTAPAIKELIERMNEVIARSDSREEPGEVKESGLWRLEALRRRMDLECAEKGIEL